MNTIFSRIEIAMAFRIIQANTIAFIHNTSVLLALDAFVQIRLS